MLEYFEQLRQAEYLRPDLLWSLWLVPLLLLLGIIRIRGRLLVHLLRALAFALLLLAIAGPVSKKISTTEKLTALFDVSYSIGPKAQRGLAEALAEFASQRNSSIDVYPFAKSLGTSSFTVEAGDEAEAILERVQNAAKSVDTGQTNLGNALEEITSKTTSSSVLLLTDGFETAGDGAQKAREASSKGLRVFPLLPSEEVFTKEKLHISSLHAPITAAAGDKAPLRVSVQNGFSEDIDAELQVWREEEKLFSQQLSFPAAREKLIELKTDTLKGGLHRLRAVVRQVDSDEKNSESEQHRWISVKEKDKLLLISGKEDDETVLKDLIRLKGYGLNAVIADGNTEVPTSFNDYSSVILNNASKAQLPKGFLPALKRFVETGGGALLLGGDRSFGLTPLEDISPLKFVPPQTKKRRLTVAVVLVMDKSGSMAHQNKIGAAKMAAIKSIESLKDDDFVGVIGFDHSPFVIIDLKQVDTIRSQAERRLRNLTAAGKTNLLPALAAARQKLKGNPASRKHIIVLSDGKIPLASDVYVEEINRLRSEGVSVSAVALGLEADVPFLKLLSKYGKGAFYHTLDPSRLPQIFVHDIKVSTGERTLQENQKFPVGVGPGGLTSTSVKKFPVLRGFVETLPKKGSTLELITRKGKKAHPILASWDYKRGRVIAFTSDANGRWSLPWLRWAKFPTFWSQIIKSIKDRSAERGNDIDFDLRYRVNRGAVLLDLAMFDSSLQGKASPSVSAVAVEPGGETKKLLFRQIKKGRYEAVLDNARPGDYRLNIAYGDLAMPDVALTIGGESFGEVPGRGLNTASLEEIAYLSGGVINPEESQVRGNARISEETDYLFVPLLLLALALILLEVYLRETAGGRRRRKRRFTPMPVSAQEEVREQINV